MSGPYLMAALVLLLAACAYIAGPCRITLESSSKTVECEAGGRLSIISTKVMDHLPVHEGRRGQ